MSTIKEELVCFKDCELIEIPSGSVFGGYATYHNPDVIKYQRDNGL